MRFLQRSCDKNHSLHLKARIDSKSYVVNVSSIVARDRDVREITINEIVASIFVTRILNKNVKLLLTLEILIK